MNLEKMTDEELELELEQVFGTYPQVDELWNRYKNKKAALTATETLLEQKGKECDELKRQKSEQYLRSQHSGADSFRYF